MKRRADRGEDALPLCLAALQLPPLGPGARGEQGT